LSFFRVGLYDYVLRMKKNAVMTEHMELEHFPYDEQALSVNLRFNKPLGSFVLFPNKEWPSVLSINSFALSDIYDVTFQEMVFVNVTSSDPKDSASLISYPVISFSLLVRRRSGYHESNVMIPASLFAVLTLLSFSVLEDGTKIDTGSRLSITLTLLLTSVAYKFVVANSLPQVSYNTLLDWYVWGTLCFILFCAVENAIFPLLVSIYGSILSSLELYVMLALILMYIVGNAVFFGRIYIRSQRQKAMNLIKYQEEEMDRKEAKKRTESITASRSNVVATVVKS